MRYKRLGHSGLWVSELALGTMTFGQDWGWGASVEDSRGIFDEYANAGGNLIDTAVNYTNGTAEKFVGDFIAADRDHFVVATKYSLITRTGDPNRGGNGRKNMVQSLETSLKRLHTDHVELYFVHMWDRMTPVEEIIRAFDDMVRAGKVLYVGLSDTPGWVVSRAQTIAELRGWAPVVALQVPYALSRRDVEREILPVAHAFDMAVMAWGIIGSGLLTGKFIAARPEHRGRTAVPLLPSSWRWQTRSSRSPTRSGARPRKWRSTGCANSKRAQKSFPSWERAMPRS